MGTLTSRLVVSLKDDVSGPAKKVSEALKAAEKQAEAIGKGGFSDRFAQQLANLGLRARDIDKLSASWKDYARTQGLAERSSEWTRAQTSRIRAWENANISALRHVSREQQRLAQIEQNAANRRGGISTGHMVGGAAALITGHKAKEFAKNAIVSAGEFDIAVRKQRASLDIPKSVQDQVLIAQAKRIGQETKFSNTDVVRAQTATMQSLPSQFDSKTRAEVGAAIMENVRNYAIFMEADLKESADGLRSFLQSTNKDISTKEKAVAESTRATNLLVKMAKLGGMSDEDVQQFMKFGAATGTAAKLSDTTMAALASVARRSGLRGDEAGVFLRTASSKLVAPTSQGLDALTAAGIDYNKFTTMPGGLSVGNLQSFAKRRFGKGFNQSQIERLDDVLTNGDVVGNRDEFTKQVSAIVAEGFGKTKKGKVSAQDSSKIAKMVGDFYKLSVESVDSEGLLKEILSNPKMTIALLNKFFTDKHGGKASIIASHRDQLATDKAALEGVTNDPGFAKRKADEIMGGLGGAIEQLHGSVENLTLAFGTANEGWLKPTITTIGNMLDSLSNSKGGIAAATIGGSAVAAGGAGYFLVQLMRGFGLKSSAAALDSSAGALMLAARALGAGGAIGNVTKASLGAGAIGLGGQLARGGVTGALIGVPAAMKYDSEHGHPLRTGLRSFFGIEDPHEPAPWQQGGEFNRGKEVRLASNIYNEKMVPNAGTEQPATMLSKELISGVDAARLAGNEFGNAFRQGAADPLAQAVQDARSAVQQIIAALTFKVSPDVNPTAPATFKDRWSAMDNTHGLQSDYGIKP